MDTDPQQYTAFRIPADESTRRHADDLPPEEVANAILYVLRREVSLPQTALIQETARLFGFQRTGPVVRERMQAGLDLLIRRGRVKQVNGMWVEA